MVQMEIMKLESSKKTRERSIVMFRHQHRLAVTYARTEIVVHDNDKNILISDVKDILDGLLDD